MELIIINFLTLSLLNLIPPPSRCSTCSSVLTPLKLEVTPIPRSSPVATKCLYYATFCPALFLMLAGFLLISTHSDLVTKTPNHKVMIVPGDPSQSRRHCQRPPGLLLVWRPLCLFATCTSSCMSYLVGRYIWETDSGASRSK